MSKGSYDDLLAEHQDNIFKKLQSNPTNTNTIAGGENLLAVPWSNVEHYGSEHGRKTAQLVGYLADGMGVAGRDRDVLRAAAMYHDLGRRMPWQKPDPGHAERSAEIAEKMLREDPEWWGKDDLRHEVGKLIAQHKLPPLSYKAGGWASEEEVKKVLSPNDPRLQALWDAECFESARFAPNTPAGLMVIRERFNQVCTPWAKVPEHKLRWRKYRGW